MFRLIVFSAVLTMCALALAGGSHSSAQPAAGDNARRFVQNPTQTPAGSQPAKVEGCVSCHGQIEPMHKYGAETLEQLKDGKDALGLTCTACHGGNPVPRKTSEDPKEVERIKREAHVRPRFPEEWKRNG